jgi:D-serine deaminase-like pyridoxal phosphate-dependent protein
MPKNTVPSGAAPGRTLAWSLEVDVELRADPPREATAEQVEALAALLNAAEGVSLAAVETHPLTNMVRVSLTVRAGHLDEAHDRACTLVRDHISRAGLAPAILVAARPARTPPASPRMG